MSYAAFSLSRAVQCLYWTKMYPKALMVWSPLSPPCLATFPHGTSATSPHPPNPILESGELHSFCSLAMIPIRTLGLDFEFPCVLNPSRLQLRWREALGPTSPFHASRPREVARYWPSAMRAYSEAAALFTRKNLVTPSTFMPRQILVKDVLQYVGNRVSKLSKPVSPFSGDTEDLEDHAFES